MAAKQVLIKVNQYLESKQVLRGSVGAQRANVRTDRQFILRKSLDAKEIFLELYAYRQIPKNHTDDNICD